MSVSLFDISARTVVGIKNFLISVYQHLCRANYANGTWTPTVTGITGGPTVTASYQRFGKVCHIFIVISGSHVASNATITLPVAASGAGNAVIINGTDGGFMGTVQINSDGANLLKIKSYWITTGSVVIHGSYQVIGI